MERAENTDESDGGPETPLEEGEDIVDGSVYIKTATKNLADM
jgi:hypothetical protein